jgi:hypothetical protein
LLCGMYQSDERRHAVAEKHILVVQSKTDARKDAPPFIPDSMTLIGLWGIKAFGPYPDQSSASDALRTFGDNSDEEWNLSVIPLITLSEALDNPAGYLWHGDAPDWSE